MIGRSSKFQHRSQPCLIGDDRHERIALIGMLHRPTRQQASQIDLAFTSDERGLLDGANPTEPDHQAGFMDCRNGMRQIDPERLGHPYGPFGGSGAWSGRRAPVSSCPRLYWRTSSILLISFVCWSTSLFHPWIASRMCTLF